MSSRPLRVALATLDSSGRVRIGSIALITAVERALLLMGALALIADEGRSRALVVAIGVAALYALRSYLRSGLRVRVQRTLYRTAATSVLSCDPLVPVTAEGADPEVALADGVHHGSQLVADRIPALMGDAVAAVGIAIFVTATQPLRLLVVGGVGIGAATMAAFVVRRLTTAAHDAAWAAYKPLMERMLFAMRGRLELVANGADVALVTSLAPLLDAFQRVTVRADQLAAVAARAPLVAGACGVALAVVAQGHGGRMLPHTALTDLAILASILPAFVGLAQNAHETRRHILQFRPMAVLLSLPPRRAGGTLSVPALPLPIEFRRVTYRYPHASRDAVSDLSLTFMHGEPLVLSGPNGSGKSTILRMLAGLATPSSGAITIGEPTLDEIDAAQWRAKIAYLPQQPYMGDTMTVSEAVNILVPNASAADVIAALERVGILEILRARGGDPLSTRVGELSIGQRKRVAIARILLKDAPIVLLDEPDANLDADGVAMIATIASELATTKLVAVAAHTERFLGAPGVHVKLAA